MQLANGEFEGQVLDIAPSGFGWAYQVADRDQLLNEICERLAAGELLASIVRDAHMPAWSTVYAWRDSDPDTVERFRHAREAGEEAVALKAQRIVDGLEPTDGVPSDPTRDKARADIRLKILAKMNPKRWGESTQLRHADAEGQKLDTAPLVGELLSLMGTGVAAPDAAPSAAVQPRPQVTYREIVPSPGPARQAPVAQHNARPAYRPRVAREGIDDLV